MSSVVLPELIDIGVNLGHESFAHDRDEVLAQALAAGVGKMILTGTSVEASVNEAAIAALRPGILYSTAGVHPHEARHFGPDTCLELRELSLLPQVVALGEMGLDFNRDFSPRELQERAFAQQLSLAVDTGMPVFLHERDAHERFVALLKEQRDGICRGVVHCFTGTREELYAYRDLDMYIGITGWVCDERRGLHLQELLSEIPADRLLLETDAPYLLPRNIQPKPRHRRNVPANLVRVLQTVAMCLQRDPADIARESSRNARAFFDI